MGGLMYKDFVAIKGKRICIILLSAIALLCILRVIFPGSMAEGMEMVFVNDQGIRINTLDLMFVTPYICIIFTIVCFIDIWYSRLSEADESCSRIRNYVQKCVSHLRTQSTFFVGFRSLSTTFMPIVNGKKLLEKIILQ